MTRNATSIGRRRFLQTSALGLGAGAIGAGPAAGQGGGVGSGSAAEPNAGRVRMSGDGLGLTPADHGRILGRLAEEGIATGLHYAPPLHRQPVYREMPAARRPFPVADRLGDTLLSLPIGPHLEPGSCRRVADALAAAVS